MYKTAFLAEVIEDPFGDPDYWQGAWAIDLPYVEGKSDTFMLNAAKGVTLIKMHRYLCIRVDAVNEDPNPKDPANKYYVYAIAEVDRYTGAQIHSAYFQEDNNGN